MSSRTRLVLSLAALFFVSLVFVKSSNAEEAVEHPYEEVRKRAAVANRAYLPRTVKEKTTECVSFVAGVRVRTCGHTEHDAMTPEQEADIRTLVEGWGY